MINHHSRLLFSLHKINAVCSFSKLHPTRPMNMATTSVKTIREKFESFEYKLYCLPNVMSMDSDGVFVSNSAPYIDVVDALENSLVDSEKNEMKLMPWLKATSYGDWEFGAIILPRDYFASHERLEHLLLDKSDRQINAVCIKAAKISIEAALKTMMVNLSCDMDYCLQNKSELEAELGCKILHDINPCNELVVRKLEQEIFYKMMCKTFGGESADDQVEVDGSETLYEKTYMIRDFSILSFDGNSMLATAVRENYYLAFFFEYS